MNAIERCRLVDYVARPKPMALLTALVVGLAGIAGCERPSTASLPTAPRPNTTADETSSAVPTKEAASRAAATEPVDEDAEDTASAAISANESSEQPGDTPASEGDAQENNRAAADRDERPAKTFSSSRAPSRPGEAEKISFDDLVIGLQADVVFRPWMMGDRPKELDGKQVRISGFMHAGAEPVKTKEFVLLRNLECKFGPGGQADHLAQVYMKPGTTTHYPGKDPIKVEGTLKIEPFEGTDGNTWSLYKIVDAEVVR